MMGRASIAVAACLVLAAGCSGSEHTSETSSLVTTCVTLSASGDTFVSAFEPFQNFGDRPHLRAGLLDESLVQFDLSSVPSSAAIDSATLKLFVVDYDSWAPTNVHRVTAAWDASQATFWNFRQRFEATPLAGFTAVHDRSQKSIDLTTQVRRWVTGVQPNYGVLLEARSLLEVTMVSSEGGTPAQQPQLEVCYTTPDDHCSPNPCDNGGTCDNNANGFTCTCAPGYTGATCDTLIDNCAAMPCQNGGTCTSELGGYTCACPTGYTGTNCETLIDNCASDPCQNGGTCTNGVGTYTCTCPVGYTGTNCETLVDSCATGPCLNGGTCTNGIGTYTCACPDGFTGSNCEINIDDCANQPCQNGGTCIDGVNSFTCACPVGWGGALCDVNLDLCAQQPCLNGGTCNDGFGVYTCDCAAGFTGTNCEIDINDCAVNPCLNGGTCVDGVNSYTCQCAPGYTGTNCEQFGCATALDGTQCDDGNACTQTDSCQGGVCTGTNPIVCNALDQCHAAGVCDPVTAVCSNPAQPDGTTCSDGNGCTVDDACITGACMSGAPMQCDGTCDPQNGVCTPWPPIAIDTTVSVGNNLEAQLAVTLGAPAPAGGVALTVTSADPTQLVLSTDPTATGTDSVVVTVAEGTLASTTPIYVQALSDNGAVDVVASAPDYSSQSASVALQPAALFVIQGSFSTSVTSPDTALTIVSAPIVNGARGSAQPVRGGGAYDVAVASSDSTIGTVASVHFGGGDTTQATAFHPIAGGTTTLTVQQPAGFATPASGAQIAATVTAPAMSISDVTVGQNLEVSESSSLAQPAPAGGVTVTVTSADPSLVLVATSATAAGTPILQLSVPAGSSTIPAFFVQSLGGTGTVGITAAAPGFTAQMANVTLAPAALFFLNGNISTTTLSTNTTLTVTSALIAANGGRGPAQAVRGGAGVDVAVSTSNPTVGTITVSPVHVSGGATSGTTAFHPVGTGSATLAISEPSGFSTPTVGASITATVTSPGITAANPSVGKDLELTQANDLLGAPAPSGGIAVTITSNDPSRVLIAPNATTVGSASLTVNVNGGATAIPAYFLQSLASSGTTTVTVSAPGYTTATKTITGQASAFWLFTSNFSTTTHSADTSLTILSAPVVNGARGPTQPLRAGLSEPIVVTSSDLTIGTITLSPVTFPAGVVSVTSAFHPLLAGLATVAVLPPTGFIPPPPVTNTITATVTP